MRILIVKTSSLGDAIHIFPVIDYLRRVYPKAVLDWVVEEPLLDLVRSHPCVDRVIPIDTRGFRKGIRKRASWKRIWGTLCELRREHYDLVFDLQGNIKSSFVTGIVRSKCKVGFGRRTVSEWPNLLVTRHRYDPPAGLNARDEYLYVVKQHVGIAEQPTENPVRLQVGSQDEELVRHLIGREGIQVAVCPGSAWTNKRLTEGALKDFLDRMHVRLHPHFLWIWGSKEERGLAEELRQRFPESSVVVPKLSLPVLQRLMWQVDLVVAMDSLALHLAGTTATPTFSVFGPSSPEKFKPMGSHHHVQGKCPYGQTFSRRCTRLRTCPTGACIRHLTGEVCFDTFISWWTSSQRSSAIQPPPNTYSPS